MFQPGDTVGRYSIIRSVGQGPHFDVFQARAFGVEGFERDVALKLVRDVDGADARLLAALRRALSLSHAGVVQLVDSDTVERDGATKVYFVTELARGDRLADVLPAWRSSASGRTKLLRLASDVARVLDYAARRRTGAVFHGRLHAGQIFVGPRGDAKISDFAVAAAASGADPVEDSASDLAALAELVEGAASGAEFEAFVASLGGSAMTPQRAAEELLGWSMLVREEEASTQNVVSAPPPPALELHLERTPLPDAVDVTTTPSAPAVSTPSPPSVKPRASTGRFVGRHHELATLGLAIADAAANGARWVHVVGGAGLGSSRLIAELGRRIPTERVTYVRIEGSSEPLSAVANALRALLELPAEASESVPRTVASLRAMGLTTNVIASVFGLLGVRDAVDEAPADPETALLASVSALQSGRPLVLAFDGDPAIDEASAQLLRRALARDEARGVPLLLLSPAAIAPDASASDRESVLELESLSDDELAQLISSRVGARVIEPDLFEAVADVAGGNPLFVEELLRWLSQEALLVVQGGVASLRGSELELPSTLRQLAESATARASVEARAVVSVIAACSNAASPEAVAAAVAPSISRAALETAVRELVTSGIVRDDERGRLHLPRAHAPTEDLAAEARVRLGEHFESVGEHDLAAQHYEAAGALARAATAWERASDVLADRADAADASVAALLHALRASREPAVARARLARAEERLPRATELSPDVEEALGHALSILDADAGTDAARVAEVASLRLRLAEVLRDRASFEAALVLLSRAAEHTPESVVASLRVSIAVAAGNPELAPDAPTDLARSGEPSIAHRLDVAEWSWLRGEFESASALLGALPGGLEPRARARALRIDLSVAVSLRTLAADDPRVDELLALASTLSGDPEAARCFWCMGVHLRRASRNSHRARAQFVLHEAAQLADAARDRRVASLARAELALATRRAAATKEVLSQAERARAAGDAYSWLSLRASVAELTQAALASAAVLRDAAEASLRGVVAHLDVP